MASLVAAMMALGITPALADGIGPITTGVPTANPKSGTPATVVAPGFALNPIVTGTDPIENPSGVITTYGYLNNGPGDITTGTRTEGDRNTYLVLKKNPGGPTPNFNYGKHFLYTPHEVFGLNLAYVTRENLDVTDPAHRITLLTPVQADGFTHLNDLDGSAYNPHTNTFMFTSENGGGGGIFQLTLGWPPVLTNLDGIVGKAGFEGINPDVDGNVFLVEDSGGAAVPVNPADPTNNKFAKQPNSFVYRFVPYDKTDLTKGGKLQALQVTIDGSPVTFHVADPIGDTFSTAQLKLHTPGTAYPCAWVTVHDTGVLPSGSNPPAFDANGAAKAAGATPFKRPENGAFLPDNKFRTYFFTITGDTDNRAGSVPDLAARGAWGGIFKLSLNKTGDAGKISMFALGDVTHNSFDNLYFGSSDTFLTAEDRGDQLHTQLNTMDSIWAYSTTEGTPAKRFVALGRDANTLAGGDNEPTGIVVSDGKPVLGHMVGKKASLGPDTRAFFNQQHGFNTIYEILQAP
jgi:hypothetical protein